MLSEVENLKFKGYYATLMETLFADQCFAATITCHGIGWNLTH